MADNRLVISLGGNAFVRADGDITMAGQFEFAARTLAPLKALLAGATELLVTHGNGPQVGYILTRVEEALGKAYALPLEVCVAESEGEIGYVLQQTIHNLTAGQRPVTTLLTQVEVDAADPGFQRPDKPIGPWFEPDHCTALARAGIPLVRDSGGRGRRVVASPQPLRVVETEIIRQLLQLGIVVIAAGGGGIPVIRRDGVLEGVEAVVDKDRASALLAEEVGATQLLLVTGVTNACTDFGTDRQQPIGRIGAEALAELATRGHFPAGSMGPKVEAAIQYVAGNTGRNGR